MKTVYEVLQEFKTKFPGSIAWRTKKHCAVIEKHLNLEEKVIFAFAAQKNNDLFELCHTYVFALTNKRILIASKRLLFGYFLISVTPDLFNDLKVRQGLFWGGVTIDTVKELICFSNVAKKGLDEIETRVSEFMMEEKKKYIHPSNNGL